MTTVYQLTERDLIEELLLACDTALVELYECRADDAAEVLGDAAAGVREARKALEVKT